MDDPLNSWRRQELIWSLRWLAAEPRAALAAVPGICTADEIALDIDHWLNVARDWKVVDKPVLDQIAKIDAQFEAMSGPGNDGLWTDEALTISREWARQRRRARTVLAKMGESRADADIGKPRPGGPTYAASLPGRRGADMIRDDPSSVRRDHPE